MNISKYINWKLRGIKEQYVIKVCIINAKILNCLDDILALLSEKRVEKDNIVDDNIVWKKTMTEYISRFGLDIKDISETIIRKNDNKTYIRTILTLV